PASPLRCAFAAPSAAKPASTSTSVTIVPATRVASARPAAPTPAPRSTMRSPPRAGVAAASRMASWPTRCPRFGCARRSRPPNTASSVRSEDANSLSIGAKLVPEPGLFKQLARLRDMIVGDQQAARQHAERALEHAHVLIKHDVRNFGAVEQGLHVRNQDRIVGAYEFTQRPLLRFAGGPNRRRVPAVQDRR